jgi:hypothetical protein
MEVKDLETIRVDTKDKVADILTKPLPTDQFQAPSGDNTVGPLDYAYVVPL